MRLNLNSRKLGKSHGILEEEVNLMQDSEKNAGSWEITLAKILVNILAVRIGVPLYMCAAGI